MHVVVVCIYGSDVGRSDVGDGESESERLDTAVIDSTTRGLNGRYKGDRDDSTSRVQV